MARQKEEADQMLIAARQDGEKLEQQREIQELKIRCWRLEEQLSASDREQDRLHQENMRLHTAQALARTSSPVPAKLADTATTAAPEGGTAQKESTATEKEASQEDASPEAAAAPLLGLAPSSPTPCTLVSTALV